MDWNHLLLRFDGRINRAKYWLVVGITIAALMVGFVASVLIAGPGWILLAAVALGAVYVGLAAAAKRLHDRNKSAWWLVLFYAVPAALQGAGDFAGDPTVALVLNVIAFAIGVWAVVELGILRGTAGPNDYGPDPLGPRA